MARQLTEAEFKKLTGLTPQEYEVANPDFVAPIPKKAPRRYGAAPAAETVTRVQEPAADERDAALDAFLAGPEQVPVKPVVQTETKPIKTNEKPYKPSQYITDGATGEASAFMELVNEIDDPAIQKDLADFVAADTQRNIRQSGAQEQLAKNTASGVLQIPASIPATVDLARIGVPAVIRAFSDVDPSVGRFKQIANEFMDGMLPAEQRADLERHMQEKLAEFRAAKPDATPEQDSAFIEQYQDSQEFFDELTSKLPAGFRMAQYANDWANKQVGLGRPDEQTIYDDIGQVFGQSITGLPSVVRKAVSNAVTKGVGEKVANSAAMRAAGRVAELTTPMSLPYTPGNIAANVGVGAAATEAIRYGSNQPSLLNGAGEQIAATVPPELIAQLAPIEAVEPADGHGTDVGGQIDNAVLSSGATLGMVLSPAAARRQIVENAMKAAEGDAVAAIADATTKQARDFMRAGPTLEQQANKMEPQLSVVTGLVDANAPAKKAAQKFKKADDTETVPRIDAAMSAGSTVSRIEAENKALNFGILDNHADTIPFRELERAKANMSDETYDTFRNYVLAVSRDQDRNKNVRSLNDAIKLAETDYNAAIARGDNRSASAKRPGLEKLKQQLQAVMDDAPESRSSMVNMSQEDVRAAIRAGESNPEIQQLVTMMKRIGDDSLDYKVANGVMTPAEAMQMKMDRDLYFPLRERYRPDVTNPIKRQALLFKDRMFPDQATKEGFYTSEARRNVSGQGAHVNNPKDPIEMVKEGLMDAVRMVTANNARKEVIDLLDALPDARGRILRPYEFDVGNGRKITELSDAQFEKFGRAALGNKLKDVVRVTKNGKVQFWEFSDKSLTKSLQFAPLATVPLLNATRKVWQTMTTGLGAPWFAAKTFFWDVPLAKSTNMQGRSLGLIDTYARKLFGESALVNTMLDHVFDPSAYVSALAAIPYQASLRAMRGLATKIEDDLIANSGVFAALAKVPGGREMLTRTSLAMAATFDRSAFNIMQRKLSTSMAHLNDLSKMREDYSRGHGNAVSRSAKSIWAGYVAMIESVQNATRVAFFAENYGRLKSIHKGKIPKAELDKLVQETRNLTGDMSRTSNSPTIQRINSVIPYGNPILQGTRHILSAAVPPSVAKGVNAVGGNMLTDRTNKFWSQFLSGVMLPKLGALAVLSQWEGADDFWYNKTPEWEQQSYMPIPNAEALNVYLETGQWPKFDPDFLNKVPISPEFGMFTAPIEAGLRALGVIGDAKNKLPGGLMNDLGQAFDQITSFATPPLIQAVGAINGARVDLRKGLTGQGLFQEPTDAPAAGANSDMMTFNSDYSRALYDVIGALAGASAQMAMQSLNVADIAHEETDSFWKAADAALDTFKYETKRRFPAVDVPMLYNARERQYSFTPESKYVFETTEKLKPVFDQLIVERDKKGRVSGADSTLETPNKIANPLLRGTAQMIYDAVKKKGPFKAAAESYTDQRATLAQLEASRARWPEDAYHEKRNAVIQTQQRLKEVQARILVDMEKRLKERLNRPFMQQFGVPFSYGALSDAIRNDVKRE